MDRAYTNSARKLLVVLSKQASLKMVNTTAHFGHIQVSSKITSHMAKANSCLKTNFTYMMASGKMEKE